MLTLHTWSTPNGRKISIMLEELGVPYETVAVDINKGEQFAPAFLAISPNNKIPALVDTEPDGEATRIFESGAILVYLADKFEQFLPPSGAARYEALQWMQWQIGGLGPMFGQLGYFAVFAAQKNPEAEARYLNECQRLIGVLERRLGASAYLGGADYSIADMAAYPWVHAASTLLATVLGETLSSAHHVQNWMRRVGERPGVQRGMVVPSATSGH